MARHIDFGKQGEDLAAGWLIGQGYEILCRNWRENRCEVDIIARRQGVCHFIEVKSGRSDAFGHPEARISKTKIKNMMRAAAAWLCQFPARDPKGFPVRVQYDVLAITIRGEGEPEYFFIPDVYA